MKCADTGTLQSLIDGELNISFKKEVEAHLDACGKCRQEFDLLKKTDDFVFDKMNEYKSCFNDSNMSAFIDGQDKNNRSSQGYRKVLFGKYRKVISAACAVIILTGCITVQPVRAFIADALKVFRVESVKGINITMRDMDKIQKSLEDRQGEIDIDRMGRIVMNGFNEEKLTVDEAHDIEDFDVILPAGVYDAEIDIKSTGSGRIEFTLDADEFNNTLESLGATELLPGTIDGKTFTASFNRQISVKWSQAGNNFTMTQEKAPELLVPEDVDEEEIYNCMVELPVIPSDLKKQLKAIKDWKSTVYIPVVDSEMEEVNINGVKGFIAENNRLGEGAIKTTVIWYNQGVIYSVSSNASKGELLDIALAMR